MRNPKLVHILVIELSKSVKKDCCNVCVHLNNNVWFLPAVQQFKVVLAFGFTCSLSDFS